MPERAIQRLYLYDEPDPSIRDFLDLSVEQLSALVRYIDTSGSVEPKEILALAAEIGRSYEKTLDLVQQANFLERERTRLGLTADDMIVEFETYLDRHPEVSELKPRLQTMSPELKRLFSDRPELAFRSKVATVTSGIVPQAIDFHSLCDLRPVFNEPRDAILEYVPVALVRVLVQSDVQEVNSSLIFQLDRNGISKLEDFLARLKKKMALLEGVRMELLERKK
jgi:hypothetical protein